MSTISISTAITFPKPRIFPQLKQPCSVCVLCSESQIGTSDNEQRSLLAQITDIWHRNTVHYGKISGVMNTVHYDKILEVSLTFVFLPL